jgi:hypothetical protein
MLLQGSCNAPPPSLLLPGLIALLSPLLLQPSPLLFLALTALLLSPSSQLLSALTALVCPPFPPLLSAPTAQPALQGSSWAQCHPLLLLSYPTLSYSILSYPILSYPILSYLILCCKKSLYCKGIRNAVPLGNDCLTVKRGQEQSIQIFPHFPSHGT